MKKIHFKNLKLDKVLLISLATTALIRIFIYLISLSHTESFEHFLKIWTMWDSSWYISIAQNSYLTEGKDAMAIVFYPGYPLFIAIFNTLFNNYPLSAIMVALFFTFVSATYLYKLTLLDYDKLTAFKAV